jgi:hypothetical protein
MRGNKTVVRLDPHSGISTFYPYRKGKYSTSNSYSLVTRSDTNWRLEMGQQLSNVAYVIAFAVGKARTAAANAWRTAMADQSDRYWPEAHYMRGPGPKWRAKHAQVQPAVEKSQTSSQM